MALLWAKPPEYRGPKCSSSVKTPLDFCLPGAAGDNQQQQRAGTASLPLQIYLVLQSSFQTCSCGELADAAFSTDTIQAPLAAVENYTCTMVKTVGCCAVKSFQWKAPRAWWKAGFSIAKDISDNDTFQNCSCNICWESYSLVCGQCRKSDLDILIEATIYCACFSTRSPGIQTYKEWPFGSPWQQGQHSAHPAAKCRAPFPWKKSGSSFILNAASRAGEAEGATVSLSWAAEEGRAVGTQTPLSRHTALGLWVWDIWPACDLYQSCMALAHHKHPI